MKVVTLKYLILITCLTFFVPLKAGASDNGFSLKEALQLALENNATLAAARQNYYGVAENLAQAVSGFRPDVSINGDITNIQNQPEGNSFITQEGGNLSRGASIDVVQPVFRGGSTSAEVSAARNAITAQHWLLKETYQDVLGNVARAYWDISLQADTLALNVSNRELLQKQLEENQARFEAGELTRTDVSQAKSRLAAATASVASSQSALNNAKAKLVKLIRVPVEIVDFETFDRLEGFPETVAETLELADKQNPSSVAARFLHNASVDDVNNVIGELLPQINLVAQAQETKDPYPGFLDSERTETIQLNATIPLYQSGATRSRARQAKYAVAENKATLIETEEEVRTKAIQSWEAYKSAEFEIEAFEEQIEAATVALEGAGEEVRYGLRAAIDELDAQQELLDARVSLVRSRFNRANAAVDVMQVTGQFLPSQLGLDMSTLPQNQEVMDKIGGNWFGLDVDYTK